MLNFVLAAIILATAALSPAAAFSPSARAQQDTSADRLDCECCDEGAHDAAMACAAFCHAALPSLVTALPQSSRADVALLVMKTDDDGLALQPPAPPPRG